jgi:transposase
MAYMTHKRIKGITYYYAEESEWKDGKSRRKWQKYLGPLSKIIAAIEGTQQKPQYAEIFELGCPAAYFTIVNEIKATQIFDSVFPKRQQGLSTGFYLTLAAVNRGIEPVSKRSMWNWFCDTVLLRAFPEVDKTALTSQRFWDNMAHIPEDKMRAAWMKLINSVLERENIDLSNVSFDGTNFYSFIGSFNMRCSLAKRGKNKQGRTNLRQINYALFCTRKDHIPLYFDVFEGNRHDSKEFGIIIEEFLHAFEQKRPSADGITVIFDKGNNSDENIKKLINASGYHFVGSVKLTDHKDLAQISNDDKCFISLISPRLEGVKAFRTRKKMYGKELTVVVTFNNTLYTSQVKSINNEMNKCLDKLSILSEKLTDRSEGRITKGKPPTMQSVKSQISSILSGQHMKALIKTTVSESNGVPVFTYKADVNAYDELADTYLGKTIHITDHHSWTTEDIILAYRSQYIIEDAFKQMKDRKTGTWWPMFHWTDQMIRIHGFYCSLSLLLRALMLRKVKYAGITLSVNKLHEKLRGIREVLNVFGNSRKTKQSVVSKLDEVQQRLFDLFNMNKYLLS